MIHNLCVVSIILRFSSKIYNFYKIYFGIKYIWEGEDKIHNLRFFPKIYNFYKIYLRYRMKKYIWRDANQNSQFLHRLHNSTSSHNLCVVSIILRRLTIYVSSHNLCVVSTIYASSHNLCVVSQFMRRLHNSRFFPKIYNF